MPSSEEFYEQVEKVQLARLSIVRELKTISSLRAKHENANISIEEFIFDDIDFVFNLFNGAQKNFRNPEEQDYLDGLKYIYLALDISNTFQRLFPEFSLEAAFEERLDKAKAVAVRLEEKHADFLTYAKNIERAASDPAFERRWHAEIKNQQSSEINRAFWNNNSFSEVLASIIFMISLILGIGLLIFGSGDDKILGWFVMGGGLLIAVALTWKGSTWIGTQW